jgi:hypothetical protein
VKKAPIGFVGRPNIGSSASTRDREMSVHTVLWRPQACSWFSMAFCRWYPTYAWLIATASDNGTEGCR